MKRFVCLSFLLLCVAMPIRAQDDEDFMESFKKFRSEIMNDYKNFLDEANIAYAQFLREAWRNAKGHDPIPDPAPVPDPPAPPPVAPPAPKEDTLKNNTPIKREGQLIDMPIRRLPEPAPAPAPPSPIKEVPTPKPQVLTFRFYGLPLSVRFDTDKRVGLASCTENAVADMWQALCDGRANNMIVDCGNIRRDYDLCDWAYVQLADSVTRAVYNSPLQRNERVVLQTFILCQSGFRVRMGRNGTNLYLLVAADSRLYNYPYWSIEGRDYYLLEHESGVNNLALSKSTLTGEKSVRMQITQQNNLGSERMAGSRHLQAKRYPMAKADVVSNMELIRFLNVYPRSFSPSEYKTVWRYYALTPLSSSTKQALYPPLRNALNGKSELEKVNILLNFVQTAFEYGYDDQIWGGDRPFFAEETLYYPYSDCEDRAILFSTLVRELTGLKVALIFYPGHLYAAVHFNSSVAGDYIVADGLRYTVTDPTYIGADAGMTMPGMDNSKAFALILN